MAAVSLQGIHHQFGHTPVLRGIDLHIADGNFTVLVGPSGCGKSTLLRLVAGLEDVLEGEVRIGERIVNDLSPTERDIAMVFQNYALYPHMTVAQNMSFALRLQRVPATEVNARVARAATILGLGPLLQRLPRELSGGQRQRVAMGRAIVRDAQVFLFDEPLSNLDAKLRVQMRGEIKALHQRLGTTMVYVTHDQVEAMTMGDQVVVLNAGQIAQAGAPLALYDRPANPFVAGFLGSPAMNFLDGQVQAGRFVSTRGVVLPLGAAGAGLPGPQDLPGRPVHFGIRPEHLRLDEAGAPATVTLVEPTGALTQVALDLGGHPVTALFRERLALRPGDVLRLGTEPGKTHLFDAGSGLRLN